MTAEKPAKPRMPRHGTVRRYKAGCRCEPCKTANTDARRRERDAARAAAGEPVPTRRKRVPTNPQTEPTPAPPARPAFRHESNGDALLSIIEDALFDAGGGLVAAKVAADRLRAAGFRQFVDGPIEAAAREALTDPADAATRMRHELVYRGARALDDPDNARFYKSTVEAMRQVLADLSGGDEGGGSGDIVEAIRAAARGGDAAEVVDPA
ncbi:hypothetical protein BKA24_001680 [Microbacterium marinum]|uniref:Uncharacterized protein n=1 Tax=Microbacterium marinum TaxID=421115 RepID=A0A7W7BQH4_9MICO|nr:hypothetical protein [Microbacterium marinum]MBB4666971.1 hypothetical protein [Microbacterium marinum]